MRSTQAPTGRPMTSQGSQTAAAIVPTAKASACRVTTATRGKATAVSAVSATVSRASVRAGGASRQRRAYERRRELPGRVVADRHLLHSPGRGLFA